MRLEIYRHRPRCEDVEFEVDEIRAGFERVLEYLRPDLHGYREATLRRPEAEGREKLAVGVEEGGQRPKRRRGEITPVREATDGGEPGLGEDDASHAREKV